jgi:ubiquinone biosynthesis protein
MYLIRLIKIVSVGIHYGLEEMLFGHERFRGLRETIGAIFFWRALTEPRAVRLRRALEALGPIFVKFGQVLSTRCDLLPLDIADELARLQDQVPPFPADIVEATLIRAYGRPVSDVFHAFDFIAAASASVAQVHFAEIRSADGSIAAVAVKILRPGIRPLITHDVGLLRTAALLVERLFVDGPRLRGAPERPSRNV